MVAARRPFFPMLTQSHREAILEQAVNELEAALASERAKVAEALAAHPRYAFAVGDVRCDRCDEMWPCKTVRILRGGKH